MSSCESIQERLGAWLDGELDRTEADRVRAHVEQCAACSRERRELEKLEVCLKATLLEAAPQVAFEPFWGAVEEKIQPNRPGYAGLWERVRAGFASPRLVWAIPATLLILIAVSSLDIFTPGSKTGPRNNLTVVESIDGYGRNVGLFREDETKTTVIWLYQNQEGEDEASGETTGAGPSF